ncbi:MFS transporter [Arthrobacter sp. 3Tela_A]|uniref:MFS transporter n=1 Tax=Arthrobacter sp. 3Tela_A TaxID=3093743 RepID=UPI003BB5D271
MRNGAGSRKPVAAAAAALGGSAELVDFLIPLWAGIELGLCSAAIGMLIAVELTVSVAARPLAGRLADTFTRTRVAAAGAFLYALSCLGYAMAGSWPWAVAAAAVGGIGGALFWIAVRAVAAESLDTDSGSLAGLLSSESFGSWFFWIPAMVLLPTIGFFGVFIALAVVCLAAALWLLLVRSAPPRVQDDPRGRAKGSGLGPLLFLAGLTAVAEAGVGLLLLLHLQNAVGLEVYQIALVYLPGGIALTVLPRVLHRFTERRGRRTGYIAASTASAVAAVGLAFTPSPLLIAALWVLTCASWALLIPMHGAVVAEAGDHRLGRGMALLSNAGLIGAAAGSLLAGFLYDGAPWLLSCLVLGAVILSGAALGPMVLHRMGVRDRPDNPAVAPDPVETGNRPAAG